MSARDELALELFIGDNGNQPREASIADWEYFHAEGMFQGRIEHYEVMAAALLAAGYVKPRTITTAEEIDALLVGSVVKDDDGHAHQKYPRGWVRTGQEPYSTPEGILPALVIHEASA